MPRLPHCGTRRGIPQCRSRNLGAVHRRRRGPAARRAHISGQLHMTGAQLGQDVECISLIGDELRVEAAVHQGQSRNRAAVHNGQRGPAARRAHQRTAPYDRRPTQRAKTWTATVCLGDRCTSTAPRTSSAQHSSGWVSARSEHVPLPPTERPALSAQVRLASSLPVPRCTHRKPFQYGCDE
jgi:hypothetical protein